MENASKALIIAGAILVSILLISVAIIVMNAINDPVQQGANVANSQAIEIFNSKFTAFSGEISGASLRTLISTINSVNGSDSSHQVALTSSVSGLTDTSGIKSNKTYVVDTKYASSATPSYTTSASVLSGATTVKTEMGYVYEINISQVK